MNCVCSSVYFVASGGRPAQHRSRQALLGRTTELLGPAEGVDRQFLKNHSLAVSTNFRQGNRFRVQVDEIYSKGTCFSEKNIKGDDIRLRSP